MPAHDHDWGSRPLERLNWAKGYGAPVDVWYCGCGVRRLVLQGVSPNAPVSDPRNVAYNELQEFTDPSSANGTGVMRASPALWLTDQEKANG